MNGSFCRNARYAPGNAMPTGLREDRDIAAPMPG